MRLAQGATDVSVNEDPLENERRADLGKIQLSIQAAVHALKRGDGACDSACDSACDGASRMNAG